MTAMEKYRFRRYGKDLPILYRRDLVALKKVIPKYASVEHVGSTAVKGLGGKGIIDIVIAVPKARISKAKGLLEAVGYEFRPDAGDKDRLFFKKDYVSRGKVRRIHLHLTYYNSKAFIEMVAVRDYLIMHKGEARKYEEIKRKAVKKAEGDGKVYKKLKNQYLKRLTRKAILEA